MPDKRDKHHMHHAHHKPDDRGDNAQKIEENIGCTILRMETAEEMGAKTRDEKTKRELEEKNYRRREALKGMRHELRDEAPHRDEP
ncbi:MAG: small acid-soluble spore protein Tlp [Clostridiales bacterium]|nr:small acid-soluble spore protein Tlp [Clostridiales bacterium]